MTCSLKGGGERRWTWTSTRPGSGIHLPPSCFESGPTLPAGCAAVGAETRSPRPHPHPRRGSRVTGEHTRHPGTGTGWSLVRVQPRLQLRDRRMLQVDGMTVDIVSLGNFYLSGRLAILYCR